MPTATASPLLDAKLIAKLEALDVRSRRILRGVMPGERRSKKRGQSVEFADYRPYVEGDDLRRIDWNLYARLDALFLRLFMEEEDLQVTVLLDTSASMGYGEPDKLRFGKQLAAALMYLALNKQNRSAVWAIGGNKVEYLQGLRGRRPIPRVFEFLESLQAAPPGQAEDAGASAGGLAEGLLRFAGTSVGAGVVVLITDGLEKGNDQGTGLDEALKVLGDGRFDGYLVQVMSPQELDPAKAELKGDLRLTDAEDGHTAEVTLTPALMKQYKKRLDAFLTHTRDIAHRRGLAYAFAPTDRELDELIMKELRLKGLVG